MKTADDDIIFTYRSVNPIRRQRFEAGADALKRIDQHRTFHDWHLIGIAANEMHNECYERSGSPSPSGRGYAAVFRALKAVPRLVPLTNLEKGTRSCARWMADHWDTAPEGTAPRMSIVDVNGAKTEVEIQPPGVEAWHALLSDDLRRLRNNPVNIKRRYLEDWPPARKTKDKDDPIDDDPTDDDPVDDDPTEDDPVEKDPTKDDPLEPDPTDTDGLGKRTRTRSRKELWFTSLREIWVQGEDAWRAEFLEEEGSKSRYADDLDDEDDRLRGVAISREARAAAKDKPGGISEEKLAVAVLDAAEMIASGEVPEGPTFPDDLGDNTAPTGEELKKALRRKLRQPQRARQPVKEEVDL